MIRAALLRSQEINLKLSGLRNAFPLLNNQRLYATFPSGTTSSGNKSQAIGTHLTSPQKSDEKVNLNEPNIVIPVVHPEPIRHEFAMAKKPLTTDDLLHLDIGQGYHRRPETISDKIAFNLTKLLRIPTDLFFKKKYVHRAVMLETVAAVPGMVAGMMRHLTSLRSMQHDGGWIHHLLAEAENERMHLLTWMKLIKPTPFDRAIVLLTQGVFFNCYFIMYLFFPKMSHRFVGYLEEEAVKSYTAFLKEIDEGRIENVEAPPIAKWYWKLADDAKLRDVVLAVRADEAAHRDVNHHLSDRLKQNKTDLRQPINGGNA